MAGIIDKFRDLWNVPEEMEEQEYEHSNRERQSRQEELSSRTSRYNNSSYHEEDGYSSSYSPSERNSYNDEYSDKNYQYEDNYSNGMSSRSFTNKVLNINATAKLQVVFFKPVSFNNDAVSIADELMKSHTVLLNFEETPRDESKRVVDFISGCAYVSGGKVQRIAKNIFIITPNNVDLKGDSLLDELQNNGLQLID